jgi:hypothetical protein
MPTSAHPSSGLEAATARPSDGVRNPTRDDQVLEAGKQGGCCSTENHSQPQQADMAGAFEREGTVA